MHPYHHALSSQRAHGGAAADYQPLHSWFDATKSALVHFTHRALRHHREGIAEAQRIFGAQIVNTDGAAITVEALGLQHLAEDMSRIPSAADWLVHLDLAALGLSIGRSRASAEELAAASACRFGTTTAAVLPLHSWFLETAHWFADDRHFAMRHHSFGIFEAESRFGIVLAAAPHPLPTRLVAEWHVRTILGRIPAAADFLRRIKGQPWMAAAQNSRRRGLA
jgi:hypothetical protein